MADVEDIMKRYEQRQQRENTFPENEPKETETAAPAAPAAPATPATSEGLLIKSEDIAHMRAGMVVALRDDGEVIMHPLVASMSMADMEMALQYAVRFWQQKQIERTIEVALNNQKLQGFAPKLPGIIK